MVRRVYPLALVWLAFCSQIPAQEQGIAIALGSVQAVPGGEFSIPLTLKASPEEQLGLLVIELNLPDILSFVEVKGGPAAEVAKADIKKDSTEVKDKPGSAVKISIEAERPIPSGIFASLTFKLSDDADIKEMELEPKVRAWALDKKPVDGVRVGNGRIEVIPPLISCFFYMH